MIDSTGDLVEILVTYLAGHRPGQDLTSKGVVARLLRIGDVLQRRYEEVCSRHGLSVVGYGILFALLRAEPDHRLTPSQLNRELLVTSGGMTFVLDRLELQGWVRRAPNPSDRRSLLVALSGSGRERAERVVDAIQALETEILEEFQLARPGQLETVLRQISARLEGRSR